MNAPPRTTPPLWYEITLVAGILIAALLGSHLLQRYFPHPGEPLKLASNCPKPVDGQVLVVMVGADDLGRLTASCITVRGKAPLTPPPQPNKGVHS